MEYKAFVGIDISKETIDVAVRTKTMKDAVHKQFENNSSGFKEMLAWTKKQTGINNAETFFCMEHTGVYCLPIACYLHQKELVYRLENPYHLKHSMGIQRSKNDKADAKMIAQYAYKNHEDLQPTQFSGENIIKLQTLLSHRERLVKTKKMYSVAPKELSEFTGEEIHSYISDVSQEVIALIESKIKDVEEEIKKLVNQDDGLKKNYELVLL